MPVKNYEQHTERRRATKQFNIENAEFAERYPLNKFVKDGEHQILSALLSSSSNKSNALYKQEPEAMQHLIRLEIFRLIRHAYMKSQIIEKLKDKYNLPADVLNIYYNECLEALKQECDEYTFDIIRYNTAVVMQILNDSMVKGDSKNALRAVAELNTMHNVYEQTKHSVNVNTEEVRISFGE